MIKGGYKIVNFNGAALSGTSETIPGIYDQIIDDYDKAIMVSGVIINGELQDDAYASVKVNDDSVNLTVYGGVITVTEDNEVTFAASKTPTELAEDISDIESFLTVKNISLTFANIDAGSYADASDASIKNKLIVGYTLNGVASSEVSLLMIQSDETSIRARLKNDSNTTLSGASINIRYIG